MRLKYAYVFFLALFVLGLSVPAFGQISGDVQVTIADASGALIPNATVTIKSKTTGTSRTAPTDSSGTVRFGQLAIGEYDVKVEAAGFGSVSSSVVVNSGATSNLPMRLEIKSTQQEIVVTESASLLNTVSAQLQNSTDSVNITALPTTAGGVLALSGTAPGVVPVTPRNPFLGLGSFNSNGGRGRGNNITLDNATASDVSTTGSAGLGTVPLDGIKEFNVITNNFNAEFGRNSSAQVQIITKNGTNEFHGSLFEFFRNDKLNARDYFDRTGKASILRNNDWGATAGGAIKPNKLFYYGTYEQQKIRGAGGTRTANVPTPAQVAAGTDATAKQLLTTLQVPTDASGTVTNPAPVGTNTWAFSGRFDANLSDRDVFYARYGTQDVVATSPGLTFISSALPTNGANNVNSPHNATVSETHIFGPAVVNQFLASFGRSAPVFLPLAGFGGPEIIFADGQTSNLGIWSGLPQGRIQNTFQYLDTLSYIRGRHQFKFGGEVNRIQANSFFDSNVRGSLTYANLADFLGGRPPITYTQRFGNSVRGNRVWGTFAFIQDDFKVTRHLTINLGLRMERANGATEVNGILSNLNLNKRDALGGAGVGPLGSFDTGGRFSDNNTNWAPRFGFAWNPNGGRTTVRGGYGMAYDFVFLNPITNGRFLPPYMYNLTLPQTDFTGSNTLANIIAGTSTFQQQGKALVGTFGTTIRNFGAIGPVDRALKNPQVQHWNLTVERELPMNLIGRASYVGTKGNFLQRTRQINTIAPGTFTPPTTLAEEAARTTSLEFRNINAALNSGPSAFGNRIDPRFNAVGLVDSSANSNFHSAQFSVTRRFQRGYGFTAAYTVGKSIDDISDVLGVLATDIPGQQNPFDNRNNRAVSQFDIPQRLALTHNFEPQFGAHIQNRVIRTLAHGWGFAGSFQAQTGFPQNLIAGTKAGLADALLLGGAAGAQRPNLVGPLNINWEAIPGGVVTNKVTPSGLAQPLVGNFGSLGRNVIRINPLIQYDMVIAKKFQITERVATQLQAQAFNLFNNTTFSRPGNNISGATTFGYYQDTDTDSRNFTMVLRLTW